MHMGLHRAEKREKEGSANSFDRLMIGVGMIAPLALIPQVLKIWSERSVEGISVISWILLAGVSCMWTAYGVFHRSKALVISNALLTILNVLIVIGVLNGR